MNIREESADQVVLRAAEAVLRADGTMDAAYAYAKSTDAVDTHGPASRLWVVREAFLAGAKFARENLA